MKLIKLIRNVTLLCIFFSLEEIFEVGLAIPGAVIRDPQEWCDGGEGIAQFV